MQILTSLLTLIVLARVLGHLFTRWGQPAIVGEMVAGIVLGPAVLGLVAPNPALSGIAPLAIFLVVLNAGLGLGFILNGRGRWNWWWSASRWSAASSIRACSRCWC